MITKSFKKIVILGILATAAYAGYYTWTQWYGISEFRKSDEAELIKILREDWYLLVEGPADFSPEYMFEHHAATPDYPDNSLRIYVYRVHGKPVGFTTYYPVQGCRGRIQFLAVGREHRGKGYGKKLMEYVIKDAPAHGLCVLELVTRVSNLPARKLYERLGFKTLGEENGLVDFEKVLL